MLRIIAALILLIAAPTARAQSAQANVDSLLAADRAFAAAAANAPTPADALAAMFDAEVIVPGGPALTIGRDAALALFRAAPAWQSGQVSWRPVRGGVSADGTQGFTYGYLAVTAGPAERRARKYLAYWVRRSEGWRVVAWRQVPHGAEGTPTAGMTAPSLPGFATAPDPTAVPRHQASLAAAEQAFSDRAQRVGLAAAFREYGRADAINLAAGGAAFVTGAEAISAGVDAGGATTSPVRWSTQRSVVASSGDLGVSLGVIRRNQPGTDGSPDAFSFFTIWRRDSPNGPWRYIAE
ncbi:MAG TPA: hypothetical protein VMG08_18240 [Allosphingosinicella sp.]|nr:hypothetical protein [Allosphingosinicella sp.]